jgi:hypothetical protein
MTKEPKAVCGSRDASRTRSNAAACADGCPSAPGRPPQTGAPKLPGGRSVCLGKVFNQTDHVPNRDAGERLSAFADKKRADARRRMHLRSLNQPRLHRLALAVVEIVRSKVAVLAPFDVKLFGVHIDVAQLYGAKLGGRADRFHPRLMSFISVIQI